MSESTDLNASSALENTEQTPQLQDPYAALVLPENSSISANSLDEFKQQAAAIHLPLPALEKWIELENNRLQQEADKQQQAKQKQIREWAQETQKMYGKTWQEEVSRAVRAADEFGGKELRQLLEETGLGNHPAMVRAFAVVGKRMMEDISVTGAPGTSTDKTFTQALYGKQ